LGTTIFELETPRYLADEAYARYDSAATRARPTSPTCVIKTIVLAIRRCELLEAGGCQVRIQERKLVRVDLYPLDLGFGKPRWQRGRRCWR